MVHFLKFHNARLVRKLRRLRQIFRVFKQSKSAGPFLEPPATPPFPFSARGSAKGQLSPTEHRTLLFYSCDLVALNY